MSMVGTNLSFLTIFPLFDREAPFSTHLAFFAIQQGNLPRLCPVFSSYQCTEWWKTLINTSETLRWFFFQNNSAFYGVSNSHNGCSQMSKFPKNSQKTVENSKNESKTSDFWTVSSQNRYILQYHQTFVTQYSFSGSFFAISWKNNIFSRITCKTWVETWVHRSELFFFKKCADKCTTAAQKYQLWIKLTLDISKRSGVM